MGAITPLIVSRPEQMGLLIELSKPAENWVMSGLPILPPEANVESNLHDS